MMDFALTALVSVLFVVDPVGALPAYLAMSPHDDAAKRRATARRAAICATAVMAAFALAGQGLFKLFGLTMPAFQIAGGLILFLVAIDMLRAQRSTQQNPREVDEGIEKDDVAITPLAIPMLAGPGALSTVATLHARADTWPKVAIVYGVIAATGAACYVTLRLAEPTYKLLGRTGVGVLSRVMGLIVAGIAVQFVLDGVKAAGWVGK